MIYMASRGALGDVVYVTVNLVAGHTLDGAVPPSGASAGVSQAKFDFIALAPVAALLVSFAYAAVRLRLRRPFLLADWPMAAAALFCSSTTRSSWRGWTFRTPTSRSWWRRR